MRKILHLVLNRVFITGVIVLLQVFFFILELFQWANHYVEIAFSLRALSLLIVFYLILKPNNPAVKLAWIVPILVFPLFGGISYLAFGHVVISRKLRNSMRKTEELTKRNMPENQDILAKIKKENPSVANLCGYLKHYSGTAVWENTNTTYYADGLPYWEQLLEDLERAERFIFLEYFILGEGTMWDAVLQILEKKAKQGIEVRLIYDDFGSILNRRA